jgi:hypothetical protein
VTSVAKGETQKLPGSACFISWNLPLTIIIFFARLVHFQGGEGGCEKEYSLYACDNNPD